MASICFCTEQFLQCLVMPIFAGNWIRENMERVKNLLGKLNRFADVTGLQMSQVSEPHGMNNGDECNSALEMPSDLA